MPSNILVIVPTYNERENLPEIVKRVLSQRVRPDLLIVDDSSPDGTGEMANDIAKQNPRLHVLHRKIKNGLGRAYIDGFQWALARDYEFIMEMDGDFSHNPDDIPRFIDAARDKDLVLGSRYSNGIRIINWPLSRLMLSKGAATYVRVITGMPISDPTGGFKCFRRRALESLDLDAVKSNGYSFQVELTHKIWRQGMQVAEVPIVFTDREFGKSKMSGNIVWEAIWMVWRLLFQNGLRRKPTKKSEPPKEAKPSTRPRRRRRRPGSQMFEEKPRIKKPAVKQRPRKSETEGESKQVDSDAKPRRRRRRPRKPSGPKPDSPQSSTPSESKKT